MIYRDIEGTDIPALFDIRTATLENSYSREELAAIGVTEESVAEMLAASHRGWVCEEGGETVGFSMVDESTGELWVIAVRPGFEGRGIGSRLLGLAEDRLLARGWREFWLWTSMDPSLRAYRLYRRHGWKEAETREGQLYMRKKAGSV